MSKLRSGIGIALILLVMAMVLPLSLPKLLGYQIYNILSESMAPAYSVDSVIYVKPTDVSQIVAGDVITFRQGSGAEDMVTHRVVAIDPEARQVVTKGDANNAIDPEPVRFDNVVGTVAASIPNFGFVSEFVGSMMGKVLLLGALAIAIWLLVSGKPQRQKSGSEESESQKSGRLGRVSGQAIGAALVVVAVAYLGVTFFNYQRSSNEYDGLRARVFEANADERQANQLQENLARLKLENPDMVAWIAFDNIDISYPVMRGNDNLFYLSHSFSGTEDTAGSIFMDANNSHDFTDAHTIIYGHNMKNGSMFGQLKKYRDKGFYDDNRYFSIYTMEEVHRYEIFSYYDIDQEGDVYTLGFGHDDQFATFVDQMVNRSYHDSRVSVGEQDTVVTLSTCSTTGMRFVVHAKQITE